MFLDYIITKSWITEWSCLITTIITSSPISRLSGVPESTITEKENYTRHLTLHSGLVQSHSHFLLHLRHNWPQWAHSWTAAFIHVALFGALIPGKGQKIHWLHVILNGIEVKQVNCSFYFPLNKNRKYSCLFWENEEKVLYN